MNRRPMAWTAPHGASLDWIAEGSAVKVSSQPASSRPNSGESSTPNNWESDSVEVTLEKEGEPDERRCSDDKSSRWNCGHCAGQRKAHLLFCVEWYGAHR